MLEEAGEGRHTHVTHRTACICSVSALLLKDPKAGDPRSAEHSSSLGVVSGCGSSTERSPFLEMYAV